MANNQVTPRGNSQQPPRPHEVVQQGGRELPQEAADAIARYSAVFEENDRLRAENIKLRQDNEVLRRVDAEKTAIIADLRRSFEETNSAADGRVAAAEANFHARLADERQDKDEFQQYAVRISERLKSCVDDINAAHTLSVEAARRRRDKPVEQVEEAIADIVKQGRGEQSTETP